MKTFFICTFFYLIPFLSQANYTANFATESTATSMSGSLPQMIEVDVVLNKPVTEPILEVNIAAITGSADRNLYQVLTPKTYIPQGESKGTIIIQAMPSETANGTKDFGLQIKGDAKVQPGSKSMHKIELHYDTKVSINITPSVSDMEGNEGDSTTISGTVSIDTALDFPLSFTLAVESGSAAEGTDFILNTTTVTIPSYANSASFNITILGDNKAEQDESATISIVLSSPTRPGAYSQNTDTITLTIIDDDESDLRVHAPRTIEGQKNTYITLTLSSPMEDEQGFNIVLTGKGTATHDKDFSIFSAQSVYIPAGETKLRVPVRIIDDKLKEESEYFEFRVDAHNDEIKVSPEYSIITIEDNDNRDFTMVTNYLLDDPEAAFNFIDFVGNGKIYRNGPYKYKTREVESSVLFTPDRLRLSGEATVRIKTLEFNKKWKPTKLEVELLNFPKTMIPGPHMFLQVFTPMKGMVEGETIKRINENHIIWSPNLDRAQINLNSDTHINMSIEYDSVMEDKIFESSLLHFRLRK